MSLIDFWLLYFPSLPCTFAKCASPWGRLLLPHVQIKMRLFGMHWSRSHDLAIDDGPRCSVDGSTRHRGCGYISHWT